MQLKLDDVLQQFGLHSGFDMLITDNGSNVVKAFAHLSDEIDDDDLADYSLFFSLLMHKICRSW